MKVFERGRNDWIVVLIILVLGFLCVIAAGQLALRFASLWQLNTNMDSHLDPNSDFLTQRPIGFIEAIDPSILTQPGWIDVFLTPGASFVTGTPFPVVTRTRAASPEPTTFSFATSTAISISSRTATSIYFPPTQTATPKPVLTATSHSTQVPTFPSTPTDTSAATATDTQTATPTVTGTPSATGTSTLTPTPTTTGTATNTPGPVEPNIGAPDGNTTTLVNGTSVSFSLSGLLLDGNSNWDVVYYEKQDTSTPGQILLGAVRIEIYDQTTATWYTIYQWGDGIADTNASYNNGNSEPDGFPVNQGFLYGIPPLNTGIAIDLDTPAIGQGASIGDPIIWIRITSLSSANCDIDAIQMLR